MSLFLYCLLFLSQNFQLWSIIKQVWYTLAVKTWSIIFRLQKFSQCPTADRTPNIHFSLQYIHCCFFSFNLLTDILINFDKKKNKRIITGHPIWSVPHSKQCSTVSNRNKDGCRHRMRVKGQQGNKTLIRISASKAQCRSCYQIRSSTRSF